MTVNQKELKHHLSECKKSRTCFECKQEFQSIVEYQNHLRVDCERVIIQCSDCDQELTRRQFREHSCYKEHKRQRDDLKEDLDNILQYFCSQNNQMKTMNVRFNEDIDGEFNKALNRSVDCKSRNEGIKPFFTAQNSVAPSPGFGSRSSSRSTISRMKSKRKTGRYASGAGRGKEDEQEPVKTLGKKKSAE